MRKAANCYAEVIRVYFGGVYFHTQQFAGIRKAETLHRRYVVGL